MFSRLYPRVARHYPAVNNGFSTKSPFKSGNKVAIADRRIFRFSAASQSGAWDVNAPAIVVQNVTSGFANLPEFAFEGFVATRRQYSSGGDDRPIDELTWKRPGSGFYSIIYRAIGGALLVTGDVPSAIYQASENAPLD